MIVTLLRHEGMRSVSLPEQIKGQYWIKDLALSGDESDFMCVEAINNQWIVKSNNKAFLIGKNKEKVKEAVLLPFNLYAGYHKKTEEPFYLFVEPVTEDRKTYTKYLIASVNEISIGRKPENLICFKNHTVSSEHAKLISQGDGWKIIDLDSTNGTFINGYRIKGECELNPGDMIYIMGMKIIIGKGFISINNPDGLVSLAQGIFTPYVPQMMSNEISDDEYEDDFFYRSPRFKRDFSTKEIDIDSPPATQSGNETPVILAIGPSITMGLTSVISAFYAVSSAMESGRIESAIPSIAMSGSMFIGTVLWPIISRRYEKKRRLERESLRQFRYKNYLESISAEITKEKDRQKEILNENYLSVDQCKDIILNKKSMLWEREFGQNDFLKLRIGVGSKKAAINYNYSGRRFVMSDDNLQEEMLALCEKPCLIDNVPIEISLFDDYISGVVGDNDKVFNFAKGIILQLSTYYSYDEFKLVFLINDKQLKKMNTIKWIPHVWSDDRSIRFIATDTSEMKDISLCLENELKKRQNSDEKNRKRETYYLVLAFDRNLALKSDVVKMILSQDENLNFGMICFYDSVKDLPKECSTVVELKNNSGCIYNKLDMTGEKVIFNPDIFVVDDLKKVNISLANTILDNKIQSYNLPKVLTFLEMYGVGKVEHLNALTRWKENNPVESLGVPVGVDVFGDIFTLDLHEKYQGPHGLIAGMTGSGKSEFIMTFILSLALNYHPYEVAFILIDYKGGGMAKAFEKLPHTAGIITNLDGSAVNRSLASIESELSRRQELFLQLASKLGESNIDIYKYQKLYRDGVVDEPLQHLFIISDEFAELKSQRPEFMSQLISAARIGRSLGVHLILATQKPSGVVDDQIWSNSKFKVCLKVQDRSDSMEMIKRPDAAELSDTGRFYLQVGYNEMFELGQSAWSGASYYPNDQYIKDKDDSVEIISLNGHVLKTAKHTVKNLSVKTTKQLDAVTEYLARTALNENIHIRQLWLDPIEPIIIMNELKGKYKIAHVPYVLNPLIGEYDDPSMQRRCPLTLPISEEGNTIVYGSAGNGKTTFINALCYSLITEYSPSEVSMYIMDYSSETLKAFEKAPHVGDVILPGENEKVVNLIRMIGKEYKSRKKRFSDYGGDYKSFISRSGEHIPNIVIIINNYSSFIEDNEGIEDSITLLSREGVKYGIYLVISTIGVGSVRLRILQNFKQLFALRLNDQSDYSSVVGRTGGLYPAEYKGRGLFRMSDNIYEFQTAHICSDDNTFSFIENTCKNVLGDWKGEKAKRIPVLPEMVDSDYLKEYYISDNKLNIPVGVSSSEMNVITYPFGAEYITRLLSESDEYLGFMVELTSLISDFYEGEMYILDPSDNIKVNTDNISTMTSAKDIGNIISRLFDEVVYRNNTYKDCLEVGEKPPKYRHMIIMINSLFEVRHIIPKEETEKLLLILEKGSINYNMTVIIGEQVKQVSTASYEKWYTKNITPNNGIWIGNGITDQYVLKVGKNTAEMHEDITDNFGFYVYGGKSQKMKVMKNVDSILMNEF